MKIRITLYAVVFFIMYLIMCIMPPFLLNGVSPRLLYCGILALCMFEREGICAVFCIVFGLMTDFAEGIIFGLNTVFMLLLMFACSFLFTKLLSVNILTYHICGVMMIFLCDIVYFLLGFMFGGSGDIGMFLLRVSFPKLFTTIPFMFLIYFIIKSIALKKEWRAYNEE